MPFLDTLGLGAAAVAGIGIGARALEPIAMPAMGKMASGAYNVASKLFRRKSLFGLVSKNKEVIGGAAIGGVIGGIFGDDALGGALKGAAVGGLGTLAGQALARPGIKFAKFAGPLGWSATKTGWGAAKFAIRHPYMTAGAVGTGAYLATHKSPYESPSLSGVTMRSKFDEEQMAVQSLQESGVAPMGGLVSGAAVRNQKLMESTRGLVQGLHASRH